jgi:hypothetical protein
MRGSRQTVLLARRAPTIKRWSLDARSEEQSAYSLWESRGVGRPSLDARSWDHPSHPLLRDSSLRPCWTAFLSSLQQSTARDRQDEREGSQEVRTQSVRVAPFSHVPHLTPYFVRHVGISTPRLKMIDAAFSLPPVRKSVESTIRLPCSIKVRDTCAIAIPDNRIDRRERLWM